VESLREERVLKDFSWVHQYCERPIERKWLFEMNCEDRTLKIS